MKDKTLIIAVFLLIIIAGAVLINQNSKEPAGRVCFESYCFDVELAITSYEHGHGLMFREYLDSDRGMLFIFKEEGAHSFWMKNTLIPLDIIWINSNKEVVFINENTPPCEKDPCPAVSSGIDAKYVLEISGGMTKKIGLTPGNKIDFDI